MTLSRKTRIATIATFSCGILFALLLIVSWFFDEQPAGGAAAVIDGGKAGLFGAVIGQVVSRIVLAFVRTDPESASEPPPQ